MYLCIPIPRSIPIYVYKSYLHTHTYIHTHSYTHAYTHTYIITYTYTDADADTNTCTHTYIHTYIYTCLKRGGVIDSIGKFNIRTQRGYYAAAEASLRKKKRTFGV